jgi:hypothetical protein
MKISSYLYSAASSIYVTDDSPFSATICSYDYKIINSNSALNKLLKAACKGDTKYI